jgi:hypothetical protein
MQAALGGIAFRAFIDLEGLVRMLPAELTFPSNQVVCPTRFSYNAFGVSENIGSALCGNRLFPPAQGFSRLLVIHV